MSHKEKRFNCFLMDISVRSLFLGHLRKSINCLSGWLYSWEHVLALECEKGKSVVPAQAH